MKNYTWILVAAVVMVLMCNFDVCAGGGWGGWGGNNGGFSFPGFGGQGNDNDNDDRGFDLDDVDIKITVNGTTVSLEDLKDTDFDFDVLVGIATGSQVDLSIVIGDNTYGTSFSRRRTTSSSSNSTQQNSDSNEPTITTTTTVVYNTSTATDPNTDAVKIGEAIDNRTDVSTTPSQTQPVAVEPIPAARISTPEVQRQATGQAGVSKATYASNTLDVSFTILEKEGDTGAVNVEKALAAKVNGTQTLDEYLKSLDYSDAKQRKVLAQMILNGIEPQQNDQFFDGVLYSWGNITSNLGASDVFCINGSMVAYGGDPSTGSPGSVAGKGRMSLNSGNVLMQYDPKKAGLLTPTVTLKRVQWNSY